MNQASRTLLIIDDSPEDRELYRRYLRSDRDSTYRFIEAGLGQQGLDLWCQHRPDAVLLDYRLPDLDGLEFLAQLQTLIPQPYLPIIVVTGQGNEAIAVQAMKAGAQDYLVKEQITPERLKLAVDGAIATVQLHAQLSQRIERERLVAQITRKIHQSLDLDEILQTTVDEVRQFLQTDRVLVFRMQSDGWGTVITESVSADWTAFLSTVHYDPCLSPDYLDAFRQGLITVKPDIHDGSIDPCHVELLTRLQVRANLVVPILQNGQLWGMLIAHHCAAPRQWQSLEIDLLKELAIHVSIALQQAELYQQTQTELAERRRAEAALRQAKAELEIRVAERTQALQAANDRLSQELLQREQIEHQLRQSETRYRAIVEDQTELITRFAPDSTLLFVNDAYCRYFNVQRDEMIGKSYKPIIYAADRDRVTQLIQSMNAKNPLLIIENRMIDGQGRIRWTQWVNRMLFDAQGNVSELQAVGRDITDLKQAEQALRDSQERLQLAIEASGDGIWDWTIPTDEIYFSPQIFQMLGYEADELPQLPSTWYQLVHPDDLVWVQEILAGHLQDRSVRYEFDYRLRTKSGEWKWVADYGKVVAWDEAGHPLRMIGTHRDIHKRKQVEASLLESDRRWRSLLDNVQLVVIELDSHGKVEYINPFYLKLTGYHHQEVLGQYWFGDFLPPSQRSQMADVFREVVEHNFYTHYQNSILTQAGEERMISWSNTVLRDAAGQAIGTISIGEDITERYQVERMKAEFISIVSHELRTPLTSMQAALSLLSEKLIDPNSEIGEATIQIATEGTDRLVRLVSDILDLERLESGKIHLERHPCPVDELVNTALAQMQEMAHQSGIRLVATACPVQIYADSDRILQVLINLLSNAIKFSPPESTVWLTAEVQHPSATADEHQATPALASSLPLILFTITDQGRGIPADSLDRIFDRFHQVDASDSREKGGTGLGLAICRSIIQQHGGKIWVESTIGKGSRFYFTVPMTGEPKRET